MIHFHLEENIQTTASGVTSQNIIIKIVNDLEILFNSLIIEVFVCHDDLPVYLINKRCGNRTLAV